MFSSVNSSDRIMQHAINNICENNPKEDLFPRKYSLSDSKPECVLTMSTAGDMCIYKPMMISRIPQIH